MIRSNYLVIDTTKHIITKKEKKILICIKSGVVSFEEATPLSKPKPIEVEATSQRTSITS